MADSNEDADKVVLPEPDATGGVPGRQSEGIWMRGLWTLILFLLFGVAEMLVVVTAILQFGWMLFGKEKNAFIAGFGLSLGKWLAKTARFQSGASDEKPFPWTKWE